MLSGYENDRIFSSITRYVFERCSGVGDHIIPKRGFTPTPDGDIGAVESPCQQTS
jgi:hypothetical protein